MRRFEYVEGNNAKFWEIVRKGQVVTTRSGRIGGSGRLKEKSFDDFMAAEVEYDRQIRDMIRKGYAEVEEPSDAPEMKIARGVELRPLDGSAPLELAADAIDYLVWRMVDIEIFDRQREAPDLSHWVWRTTRRLRMDEPPTGDSPRFDEWFAAWRELTAHDRSAPMEDHKVGAFKYTFSTHWIVSAEECAFIAGEAHGRKPRRHKPKVSEKAWFAQWVSFHEHCASKEGYEVVPFSS